MYGGGGDFTAFQMRQCDSILGGLTKLRSNAVTHVSGPGAFQLPPFFQTYKLGAGYGQLGCCVPGSPIPPYQRYIAGQLTSALFAVVRGLANWLGPPVASTHFEPRRLS